MKSGSTDCSHGQTFTPEAALIVPELMDAPIEERSFWVYVLRNPEGRFYVGQTEDISSRMLSHNTTGEILGKFTRKNGPWELVWKEPHATRSDAMRREREIKGWKSARMIRAKLLREG